MARPLLSSLVGDEEIAAFFSAEAEIKAMLEVEAALAEAEARLGMIPADAAERIATTCRSIAPDEPSIRCGLLRDGVAVPDLVRQLRAASSDEDAPFVHLGATSQDIVDTALMLRLNEVFLLLQERLAGLLEALDELAKRDGDKSLMAQTRMQAALPFTAGARIAGWRAQLERSVARLSRVRKEALAVQFGGPVGDGSSFTGHAAELQAHLADALGLVPAPAWHSGRDRIMEIAEALALLSGSLGKIGQDVALMAQSEVGAVAVAGGGTSSAMAHKQNPVAAELLVALARYNAGLIGTLHQSMVHENERSGAAWTLEWMCLPPMAETTGCALRLGETLLAGLAFRGSPRAG